MKKILILGITGMLGHILFNEFSQIDNFDVWGTVRITEGIDKWFNADLIKKIIKHIDAENLKGLKKLISEIKPEVVINCIGIVKQIPLANDPISSITINALFPHQVAKICKVFGSKFIHVSTDCVFSGRKGNYSENDLSDAEDLYGRTKFLGEVKSPNSITLRTSIIGHELKGKHGLIEWFMSQHNKIKGFTHAIFSGFPTIELAHIISKYVIPNERLAGLYNVSSNPISKYELLKLVVNQYGKNIEIEPYEDLKENRSLNSVLFQNSTGYSPPPWENLIEKMYKHYSNCYYYHIE